MWRRAVDILQGHRSAFSFGLPWYIDAIAMEMGKVEHEHCSRMAIDPAAEVDRSWSEFSKAENEEKAYRKWGASSMF